MSKRPNTSSTLEDLKTIRNIERALEDDDIVEQAVKTFKEKDLEFRENEKIKAAVNPKHYKDNIFGKELIDVMGDLFSHAELLAYCKINVFKYRMRAGKKSDNIEQDIQKALWYEQKAIELQKDYDNLPF